MELVRHRQTKETEQIGFTYGTPRQSSTLQHFSDSCSRFLLDVVSFPGVLSTFDAWQISIANLLELNINPCE